MLGILQKSGVIYPLVTALDAAAMLNSNMGVFHPFLMLVIVFKTAEFNLNIIFLCINIGEIFKEFQNIPGNIKRTLGCDCVFLVGITIF